MPAAVCVLKIATLVRCSSLQGAETDSSVSPRRHCRDHHLLCYHILLSLRYRHCAGDGSKIISGQSTSTKLNNNVFAGVRNGGFLWRISDPVVLTLCGYLLTSRETSWGFAVWGTIGRRLQLASGRLQSMMFANRCSLNHFGALVS